MAQCRFLTGFTLIELMIVVAIVAILAAIALPAYQSYVVRAQVSEGASLAQGAKVAMIEFKASRSAWPVNNQEAGLADASDTHGRYVTSVDLANPTGQVTVLFGGSAHPAINGRTLVFSAVSHQGSIDWVCRGKGSLEAQYRPASCRN